MAIKNVGVVGLGKMGGPLARHLAAGGFEVIGHDVRRESMEAVADVGVRPAADCRELAQNCDLAIVGVGFDSEVETVVFGKDGLLTGQADPIIAIVSTIAPQAMKDIAARRPKSIFLDIPMCRGEQAAEEGDLLLLGGGDRTVFENCRPAFETFASTIHYLGALGNGQVGKMVNNLILWACISANVEGMKLAEQLGTDTSALREALLDSSARNWALDTIAHERPMPWAEKDMSIVLREADALRISLPLCGSVKEVIKGIKIDFGQGMPREPDRKTAST